MKSKLLLAVLLTTFLALTLVSAQVSVLTSTPSVFTKTNTQTSFSVTNTGSDTVNIQITLPSTIDDGRGHVLTISSSSQLAYSNLATNQNTGLINIIYLGDTTNFKIGESSSNIIVRATSTLNSSNFTVQTIPLKFVNDFCKYGQNGSSITLSNIDLQNTDGDDLEWNPTDHIKIKVEVENNGDDKVSGVYVEMGLIDSKGKNIVNDLKGLSDKKIEIGTLSDGKSKTVEYTFQVPADFDEGTYSLVFKAYKSGKEAAICSSYSSDLESSYFQSIDGVRQTEEKKQVVVSNIQISPEGIVKCGEKVQITADITNIGDTDYENQVKVTLYNQALKIDTEQILRGDLNQGDSESVDFEFDIPADAQEKSYTLEFRTYYDFNSGDSYGITSNDKFLQTITVKGDCTKSADTTKATVQINAELDPETPEAIAGKQVIVKAIIKNLATTDSVYSISVFGNSAWSSLVSIQPESLSLKAGESKQVSIVLNVDKEAEGDKEFTIKTSSGSSSTEQRVALTVTKSSLPLSSVSEHLKKNWFIYVIILVNLVLIIAIIFVIRRMVSPRKRRDFE